MRIKRVNAVESGLLLVEILLAVALTSIITLVIMSAIIYGRDATAIAGDRSRAANIANMAIEAVNNIGQNSYDSFSAYTDDTTYYLDISSNSWQISSTPTTIDTRFTPSITFSPGPNGSRKVVVAVTWQANNKRTGSVTATTYITNWRAATALLSTPLLETRQT